MQLAESLRIELQIVILYLFNGTDLQGGVVGGEGFVWLRSVMRIRARH